MFYVRGIGLKVWPIHLLSIPSNGYRESELKDKLLSPICCHGHHQAMLFFRNNLRMEIIEAFILY